MQLNRANFLTWFSDTSEVYNPLPILNSSICSSPCVLWLKDDSMSFVINQPIAVGVEVGIYTVQMNSLRDSTVKYTLGSCISYPSIYGGFILFATFVCPSILPEDDYVLKITNSIRTSEVYMSNKIKVIGQDNVSNTAKFVFKHKFDKNGVEYNHPSILTHFHRFRLFCGFSEFNNQSSKEIINDIDSPIPREYNTSVSIGYKCNVFSLDTDRHQAVQDMITCSHLEINGRRYQSDGSYTASPLGKSGISKGTFNVQDYSLRYPKR